MDSRKVWPEDSTEKEAPYSGPDTLKSTVVFMVAANVYGERERERVERERE